VANNHERPPTPASQDRRISATFLVMVAAFLLCIVLMMLRPSYQHVLVFPLVLIGWVISLCLHEFGHAIAAYYCGDHTMRAKGYLTLNPLLYTHAQFSILWPLLAMVLGGVGLPGGAV
jgi:Zn-dependent protease